LLTFHPGGGPALDGHRVVTSLRLAFWPSPLVFDHGVPLAGFREASLYLPLAAFGALVTWAAMKIGSTRALFILVVPITALGVAARVRTLDFRSGLVLWRDTVAKAPANAHAHGELGRALMAAGLGREALAHFERALELSPGGSARSDLAMALMQLGRPADAARAYEQIVREEPRNASAHLELAAALSLLGRAAEADAHFQTARALGVPDAEWHRRRGRAKAEAGEFDAAKAELEAALRADPKSVETQVVFGMVLSAMGRPADGMKRFVAAVEMNPADAGAQAALGDALLEDLRPSEALPHFETALRLDPSRAALIHASLGRALVRLGRAKEAIEHLAAALELNPENVEAQTDLELIRTAVQRHADKK
jgi:tetratricopeptide (TPR) repeat protein